MSNEIAEASVASTAERARQSQEKKDKFLAKYRELGNVAAAADVVGISVPLVYNKWRNNDAEFKAAFDRVSRDSRTWRTKSRRDAAPWKPRFLKALEECGEIAEACRRTNVDRSTVHNAKKDPKFAKLCEVAEAKGKARAARARREGIAAQGGLYVAADEFANGKLAKGKNKNYSDQLRRDLFRLFEMLGVADPRGLERLDGAAVARVVVLDRWETASGYQSAVTAAKQFGRWATAPDRAILTRDPFRHLEYPSLEQLDEEQKGATPCLSENGYHALVAAAETSKYTAGEMTGPERAHLWRFLWATGVQVEDTRDLLAAAVKVDAAPPHVTVRPGYQPELRPAGVGEELRPYVQARVGQKLFRVPSADQLRYALNRDLKDARSKADASAFAPGICLRSFRFSYCERGARQDVRVRVMQAWMGHSSTRLTERLYRRFLQPHEVERLLLDGQTPTAVPAANPATPGLASQATQPGATREGVAARSSTKRAKKRDGPGRPPNLTPDQAACRFRICDKWRRAKGAPNTDRERFCQDEEDDLGNQLTVNCLAALLVWEKTPRAKELRKQIAQTNRTRPLN